MNKKSVLSKVLLTLALVLFAASAYAIPKEPCDQPKDVCCEEVVPGPFAFSYPKDIGLSCPRDFYAHGEFLWMKPTEEGLDFVMDQDAATTNTFPLEVGKVHGFSTGSQEWDWRPGFRVGFGFYSNHDSWSFDLNWTYLRIKADAGEIYHRASQTGTLLPLFLPPYTAISIPHASARWSGDLNTLDLGIGKPYHVSRYFVSCPMLGIRAAWIDQDYHIRYFINDEKKDVFHKNDYWGVGLRGSYEGQYLLGSGWFLYGKAAFSLLFGKFDTSQHADVVTSGSCENRKYKTEESFYNVQPNMEIGMGVCFSKFFNKNQYNVGLKVGYEFHHWFDQNQLRKFFDTNPVATDRVSRGDLSFNGFLFGLHVEF